MQVDVALTNNPAYGPVNTTLEKEILAMLVYSRAQDTGLKVYEDLDMTTNPSYGLLFKETSRRAF